LGIERFHKGRVQEPEFDARTCVGENTLRVLRSLEPFWFAQKVAGSAFMFEDLEHPQEARRSVREKANLPDRSRIGLDYGSGAAIVIRIVVRQDKLLNHTDVPL
jgi:hypothetical protein